MPTEIKVAIIGGLCVAILLTITTVQANKRSNDLVLYCIEELAKKVYEYNQLIDRMYKVETSITRRGNNDYEYGICTPGYIYNLHHAYDVAQREGVTMKEIAAAALETVFSCFIYYNVALAKDVPQITIDTIEDLSRDFFYDYYKQIQPYISEDDYKNAYSQSMLSKATHTQGIIFKMTLDDFIELMFSKEKPNLDYNELEKKIQLKIEEED